MSYFRRVFEELDARVNSDGKSINSIAREAVIPVPVLTRFLRGERGISLATADKLAAYFGWKTEPLTREACLSWYVMNVRRERLDKAGVRLPDESQKEIDQQIINAIEPVADREADAAIAKMKKATKQKKRTA
jgi:hypothetical protein